MHSFSLLLSFITINVLRTKKNDELIRPKTLIRPLILWSKRHLVMRCCCKTIARLKRWWLFRNLNHYYLTSFILDWLWVMNFWRLLVRFRPGSTITSKVTDRGFKGSRVYIRFPIPRTVHNKMLVGCVLRIPPPKIPCKWNRLAGCYWKFKHALIQFLSEFKFVNHWLTRQHSQVIPGVVPSAGRNVGSFVQSISRLN